MESRLNQIQAKALLEWQIELGATEAIGDAPVDRYALPSEMPSPRREKVQKPAAKSKTPQNLLMIDAADPVAEAKAAASAAQDLAALEQAMAAFEYCDLKRGAKNLVFADGNAEARVMIIGEAPGRDEDIQGKPFVGRAGQLLDLMLDAIGISRHAEAPEKSVYITNVLPWRPPQNRDPKPEEIAMLLPFLEKHVALVAPKVLVLMGNISCQAGLGRRGITRLRGNWTTAYDTPTLPMFHPAYLLRNPQAKREAWADLLELQARLEET